MKNSRQVMRISYGQNIQTHCSHRLCLYHEACFTLNFVAFSPRAVKKSQRVILSAFLDPSSLPPRLAFPLTIALLTTRGRDKHGRGEKAWKQLLAYIPVTQVIAVINHGQRIRRHLLPS